MCNKKISKFKKALPVRKIHPGNGSFSYINYNLEAEINNCKNITLLFNFMILIAIFERKGWGRGTVKKGSQEFFLRLER